MKRLIPIILALAMSAAAVAPSSAATTNKGKNLRVGDRYSGSIRFTSRPRMALVPDTGVYYLRDASDFDLYSKGSTWYLVERGRWYRAPSWEGPFTYVRTNTVPREIRTLPSGFRRSWRPAEGTGRMSTTTPVGARYRGTAVAFTTRPSMAIIPDTRVYYVRDESDLDLYLYDGRWYLVENGAWYRAPSWQGPFTRVRTNSVPGAVLGVPSGYRRNWVPSSTLSTRSTSGTGSAGRVRTTRVGTRYRGTALGFTEAPAMASIPGTGVYYLRDESDLDLYLHNGAWYYVENGTWYRATSWQGPYLSVRANNVPRAILRVPSGYRRHWVPPTTTD